MHQKFFFRTLPKLRDKVHWLLVQHGLLNRDQKGNIVTICTHIAMFVNEHPYQVVVTFPQSGLQSGSREGQRWIAQSCQRAAADKLQANRRPAAGILLMMGKTQPDCRVMMRGAKGCQDNAFQRAWPPLETLYLCVPETCNHSISTFGLFIDYSF